MTKLEKVEKIIEKTGVSYEDASEALSQAGDDILDAIVFLERKGKVKGPSKSVFSTKAEDTSEAFQQAAKTYDVKDEKFSNILVRVLKWCGRIIKKGCENFFIIKKHGDEIINAPVIVLVMLLIFAFWVTVPVLIAGLFFGCRYSFSGDITGKVDVNKACDKAAEAAENVKQEFVKAAREDKAVRSKTDCTSASVQDGNKNIINSGKTEEDC